MTDETKEEKKARKKQMYRQKIEERKKEAGAVRKIIFAFLAVLVLTAAAVAFGGYQYVMAALEPKEPENDDEYTINIPIGSHPDEIAEILEEEGIISSETMFRYYVRFQNESGFQAGTYELSPSMDVDTIIEELKEGRIEEEFAHSFTIPEGLWVEEAFDIIASETNLTVEELEDAARDEDFLENMIDQFSILTEHILDDDIREPLEGYLFPARYDFVQEELEAEQLLQQMLNRTQQEVNLAVNVTEEEMHEVMTKASIIEGEASSDEERPLISGVIENRLSVPMRLEMDPTVAYAHGERFARTLNEHLELQSPYNTYRTDGLPAGPINNPGADSIQAADNPEEHDYLYFFHSPDGEFYLNETYADHQEVTSEYQGD
ncbi:endolytic transglycosylase MltG [Alkalicoccus chagannorensis]|uniref:endolytic transglycosylase MltG n=1 Tax=Alkalicoccus chagannorensis TaxID=427072 RepID=UPI0003FE1228|nr:endolytic transglycosylase MltG [Alkalicoccus chagannorensis]